MSQAWPEGLPPLPKKEFQDDDGTWWVGEVGYNPAAGQVVVGWRSQKDNTFETSEVLTPDEYAIAYRTDNADTTEQTQSGHGNFLRAGTGSNPLAFKFIDEETQQNQTLGHPENTTWRRATRNYVLGNQEGRTAFGSVILTLMLRSRRLAGLSSFILLPITDASPIPGDTIAVGTVAFMVLNGIRKEHDMLKGRAQALDQLYGAQTNE